MVEHEPVHVSWTEGRLRLRATCDTPTGEVLAISVQPMPVGGDAEELPVLELELTGGRVVVDLAQGVLGLCVFDARWAWTTIPVPQVKFFTGYWKSDMGSLTWRSG